LSYSTNSDHEDAKTFMTGTALSLKDLSSTIWN